MILLDASTRWSHVHLLSSRNVAFAKLLVQIIRLRELFPDYPTKSIRLDNADEFSSRVFDDFFMLLTFISKMALQSLLSNDFS